MLINPLVRAVLGTMTQDDQFEIDCVFKAIKNHPKLGKTVLCQPGRLYYKTNSVTKRRYPNGLRIIYQYINKDIEFVAIEDIGDHRSCCSKPGYSIYLDDRRD
jgi:hypothetical protein